MLGAGAVLDQIVDDGRIGQCRRITKRSEIVFGNLPQNAAHNLAVLKHITLNLIRLDPIPRKGGIKVRRLIAATSDEYREQLFGLRPV